MNLLQKAPGHYRKIQGSVFLLKHHLMKRNLQLHLIVPAPLKRPDKLRARLSLQGREDPHQHMGSELHPHWYEAVQIAFPADQKSRGIASPSRPASSSDMFQYLKPVRFPPVMRKVLYPRDPAY